MFTLDSVDGTLAFGPALLQPVGSVYHFGAIPPKGSVLRFSRYLYGGGVVGNVSVGAISVLKASIPYIAQVRNHEPALGGRDAQSVADAKVRAAQRLRSHARAVTADDFEFHTSQVPGVARARCLAPGEQSGDPAAIKPGQVFMIVLPQVRSARPEDCPVAGALQRSRLHARWCWASPSKFALSDLVSVKRASLACTVIHARAGVQRRAEAELYAFLNPFTGGQPTPAGRSAREICPEIYGLIQYPVSECVGVRLVREPGPGLTGAAPISVCGCIR
jgi:predicted phage baseplate assembly protein